MTEFPGYLPWHVAGDPWFTYDEIDALVETARRRSDERRKQAKAAKKPGKRFRRGRGRRR
jgi:hypothetical protein